MVGGPAFAALGALRAGAGLAVLAVPAPLLAHALVIAPSATGLALPADEHGRLRPSAVAELLDEHLPGCDCVAVGPGFGAGPAQQQVVARLAARAEPPLVIDADALNALACLKDFPRELGARAVLTPHPGEYRRLAAALDLGVDPAAPGARAEAASRLAARLGCVVVLKGAATVVSDGIRAWTNTTGNVALATAGTGDVLTGIIAGLVAQSAAGGAGIDLYDCARLGVHLHGAAADRWARTHGSAGMLAGDLLDAVPEVMAAARGA